MKTKAAAGTFFGIGVGPGDAGLITMKALAVLKGCPVIALPRSSAGDVKGRAYKIMEEALGKDVLADKELLELNLPMTRDVVALNAARAAAAAEISSRIKNGRDVAFVTLGDPMTYSTFSYLVPLVKDAVAGVEVLIVPGITSFNAAAARLCLPLSEADETISIIPAPFRLDLVREALVSFDTVIVMKVNRDFDDLIKVIEEAGCIDRAYFVSKAGWPDETVTKGILGLKGTKPDYFSTVIVRKRGLL